MKKKRHEIESFPRKSDLEVSANKSLPTTRARPVVGLMVAGFGLYLLLVGLGVLYINPANVHAPLFVLAGIGIAFFSAGLIVVIQGLGFGKSWIASVLAFTTVAGFFTPFLWMVFGNDEMPPFVKICIGGFLGFFLLIFAFASVVSKFPALAARLGVRVIETDRDGSHIKITQQDKF